MKVIISPSYEVSADDFKNGNDSVDPSFKDFESTRFDLDLEGIKVGYLVISYSKNNSNFPNPFVRYVFISPEFRGNQYSAVLYEHANEYTKAQYQKSLASDSLNWISRSATKIWTHLCEKGVAIKKSNYYCFVD